MANFKILLTKDNLLFIWELFLHKTKIKHQPHLENGLIEVNPELEDYQDPLVGAEVQKVILMPDGQWDKYRGEGEKQNQGDETYSCVSQADSNNIEKIIRFYIAVVTNKELLSHLDAKIADPLYEQICLMVKIFTDFEIIIDGKVNIAKRFLANVSGTTRRGNTKKNVANAVRHGGIIAEYLCPYVNGWNKYYNLDFETIGKDKLIEKGNALAELIDFSWEWVHPRYFNQAKLYGSTSTTIYSGSRTNAKGIYQSSGQPRNHAVDNDGFVESEYDKVEDSYNPFSKKFSWYFDFGYGMLYTIRLKKNFNYKLLEQLKKDGKKIIVRADSHGEAYVIEDYGLNYKDSSKNPIHRNIPLVDYMLTEWSKEGKIHWIDEVNWKKLNNE